MEYLFISTIFAYVLFSIYQLVINSVRSDKILPKSVKYRHKYSLRIRAMIFPKDTWSNDIQENDMEYFLEYNAEFRTYLKILLKGTVIFAIAMFLQAAYFIGIMYL